MQVFHVESGAYQLYAVDKYYGRQINTECGLRRELEIYFKDRVYLVEAIIKRLTELRQKIQSLRSFRFFSTSLLIVTEGCVGRRNLNLNGISRKRHNSSSGDEDDSSLDSSSVELNSCNHSEHNLPSYYCYKRSRRLSYKCQREHSRQFNDQRFDIRMIDFAHTSRVHHPSSSSSSSNNATSEPSSTSTPSSSDGFLVGLDSLIRLLSDIKDQFHSEEMTGESDECEDDEMEMP